MSGQTPSIAVFSLAYAPVESGAEIAVREIARRLPEYSFTVFTHRFSCTHPSKEATGNVTVLRLGKGMEGGTRPGIIPKAQYIFRAVREARAAHSERPFRAIWAVMASYGGIAALFFKRAYPALPMLVSVQEGDSERHLRFGKFGLVGWWGWRILRAADSIQVISKFLAEFVRSRGARAPLAIIPNGVDLEAFRAARRPARAPDSLAPVFVTTSRLVKKNGIDILLRAFAEVKTKKPGATLKIAGTGSEERHLRHLAAALHIEHAVAFSGHLPFAEIPSYLRDADVFVRPSRSEGLGSSFLEALAAGLPVIGTRVGGITDFIIDPSENPRAPTGLLVPPDDPRSLAAAMHALVDDAALYKKLAEEGIRLIERVYTWDTVAERMRGVFRSLMESPRNL